MSGVEKDNIFSTTIRICITPAFSVAYGSNSSKSASFKFTAFAFFLHLLTPIDFRSFIVQSNHLNPLNTDLNLICHLLTLLGDHPILHVSRIRVNFSPLVYIITFTRPKY